MSSMLGIRSSRMPATSSDGIASARTRLPSLARREATRRPMKPVAPVTRTLPEAVTAATVSSGLLAVALLQDRRRVVAFDRSVGVMEDVVEDIGLLDLDGRAGVK